MEWSQKACQITWMGLSNESGAVWSPLYVRQCVIDLETRLDRSDLSPIRNLVCTDVG
jgi:hypothetical protein